MSEFNKSQEWKHQIEACRDDAVNMNEWEDNFIKSLAARLQVCITMGNTLNLSEKQSAILDRIYTERVP